ncbi:SGNH/GDSL hydrolase family protein [Amylibacter sp.]|nr:SGNH/GDSL hydrolase family protein [Amylibacter sp.]
MKIIYYLKDIFKTILVTLIMWLFVDLIYTYFLDTHGFSTWYQSDNIAGRTHKANYSGMWGGPLDEFYVKVTTGKNGERNSSKSNCKNITKKILFIGDSTTAGFEVKDSDTFVSHINSSCNSHKYSGVNLGIRGGDTHSAIGMYQKFAPIIEHDIVFYMFPSNDYWENINKSEYINLTKRFGRKFEKEILHLQTNLTTKLYLFVRISVSEYLYFTTKLIRAVERFSNHKNMPDHQITLTGKKNKVLASTPKMISLLNDFDRNIKNKKTKLIITSYPCVTYEGAANYLSGACKVDEYLERNLSSNLNKINSNIQYWNNNILIEKYIDKGCFEKKALTFKNDRHFSPFGHYVLAQLIRKHLFNDLAYDKLVLC